jgi:hypothetical protein
LNRSEAERKKNPPKEYASNHYFKSTDPIIPNFIFDDPDLNNTELDDVRQPQGAGQGFQDRPWSRDGFQAGATVGYLQFVDNIPKFGPDAKGELTTFRTWSPTFGDGGINLQSPILHDTLGDRVIEVVAYDYGIFENDRQLDGNSLGINFTIPANFPDINQDGHSDFVAARAKIHTTQRLTRVVLDGNATWFDDDLGNYSNRDQNKDVWRSLYNEEPKVISLTANNLVTEPSPLDFIRLNGLVEYDNDTSRSYFDLHVDDRFPSQFFYGFGNANFSSNPSMGGKVIVTEGMPKMNFDLSTNLEPVDRNLSSYTDQNGYYAISGLEPGLYNVVVYSEDKFMQESTFRPETNATHVSEVIYVPGLPELIMESDQAGPSVSTMVWSLSSRQIARPNESLSRSVERAQELKRIEGVGIGFQQGVSPNLIILPHPENTSFALPKLNIEVNLDSSLNLTIIDDGETTSFNTEDKFTIVCSSTLNGIDFYEDYLFSHSALSPWGGTSASDKQGSARLQIIPDDANGTNFVEVSLSTASLGDKATRFKAVAHDDNGNKVMNQNTVNWSLVLPFVPEENDESLVYTLTTIDANSTDLILRSTLQRGKVEKVNVVSRGQGYSSGSAVRLNGKGAGFRGSLVVDEGSGAILSVNISDSGSGYDNESILIIDDDNGSGAFLQPTIEGGFAELRATLQMPDGSELNATTKIFASTRENLSEKELWLDKYLDTFASRDDAWWAGDTNDTDGLLNLEEFKFDTNPRSIDTDSDGMSDLSEIDDLSRYKTNPRLWDSDGDRISDFEENATGSNPNLVDTDRDGYDDWKELRVLSTNPTEETYW